MGDHDEKIGSCICAFLFVLFLILAIAIPVDMIANTEDEMCGGAEELKQGEQIICTTSTSHEEWDAECDSTKSSYINVYRTKKSNTPTTTRNHTYRGFSQELTSSKTSTLYHTMSSSLGIDGTVYLNCDGDNCDKLKVFVLTKKEWNSALDSKGRFRDDYATHLKILPGPGLYTITFRKSGTTTSNSEYYYLAFTMKQTKSVMINFDLELKYNVYDFQYLTPKTCLLGKCEFEDFEYGEMIAMEYKNYTRETTYSTSYPFAIGAKIHDYDIDWSSVLGCAIACAFFSFIFLCCSIVFIVKAVKKIGKVGKKVGKVVVKAGESTTTTGTVVAAPSAAVAPQPVAAQPVAAAGAGPTPYDQNMAAGYPPAAQPYPAQPYPAQAGYPPEAQPYPAQAGYPPEAQPYPGGQPYPAQAGYPPEAQPYPTGQPQPEPQRGAEEPAVVVDNEQRF